ncbi:MAG: MATE family efflux transporter [Myxococcales bacterium]|nr:MATE family efflux transporter [Myxococcales bacterium]MCB9540467.1 MATE family efflux transporter [Myxococcales bacterium]
MSAHPSNAPVRAELRATVRLAWPLALAFGGNQLLGVVDTAVAGRLGEVAIAATGLANSIFFGCCILAMGTLMALDPVASQALGAGRPGVARRALRESMWLAGAMSLPVMLLIAMVHGPAMAAVGVGAETADAVTAYLWARTPSAFPLLAHTALRSYLQARHHARPVLLGTIAANVVNLPLSIYLGFGDDALRAVGLPGVGFDGWGVFGLAVASTVVMVLQMVVLVLALRRLPPPPDAGPPTRAGMATILRLGWPIGTAYLAEASSFVVTTVLAGAFGAVAVGGHNVALQLVSFTFSMCFGLSAASAVRVGHAVGAEDPVAARRAGFVGMGTGTAFMGCSALMFAVAAHPVARLVTDEPAVVDAAVPLLHVAAVFQIFDGLQAVAAGALRGRGDTRGAMVLALIGHWVIGLPTGVGLAFGLDWGPLGLWWGLSAGLGFAGVGMLLRFAWGTR